MWSVQPGGVCPAHSRASEPTQIHCIDQFPRCEAVLGAKVIGRAAQVTKGT